jgi:hypothetical protein
MDLEDDPRVALYSEPVGLTYDVIIADDPLMRIQFRFASRKI